MPEETASDILEQMSPSEATDILQSLDEDKAADILESMEEEQAESVRCLMTHEEDTAGGLMTTSFLSLHGQETVAQALEKLRREAPDLDVIYYGYVEDEAGHLQGVVNLREMLTADPQARVESIMITRPVSVPPEADPDEVAEIFAKYGLRAVPVVDEHGLLHGVIRFKALLETVAPHLGR
jgi:Mg/Co/Ni transporter MgtE